ncbi:serine protease 52-like [Zalophus californianus]|uniref:Serine protease 52-like n=1 Tax=Zalophus californianus TaxID=9704 RepID=A0A6P9F906_ZALCA|nr:serine protease 52-like [Zalophus californianus]
MRSPLGFYQFWGLFFHCCGAGLLVSNSQKQLLISLTPTIAPLTASSNFPWLVSMAENCQGIILSQWWILSTASCLNKLKHLDSDISAVIDQEDILLGHTICLHPSFGPQVGMDPVKGDIGVILLQYPIRTTVTLEPVSKSCQLSCWTSHSATINISTYLKVTIYASGVSHKETAGYLLYKGRVTIGGRCKTICKM